MEMGWKLLIAAVGVLGVAVSPQAWAQRVESAQTQRAETAAGASQSGASESVKWLVGRLDLERYKATIKGLTQFGDRRQGTDRNRKAVDWIESQLKSYGCTNTERLKYNYVPPPPRDPGAVRPNSTTTQQPPTAAGGGRPRGKRNATGVNSDPNAQPNLELR